MKLITGARAAAAADFSARLNQALTRLQVPERGRTAELARLTGVSYQGASKWVEGAGLPSVKNVERISVHYDLNVMWLLTGKGGMFNLEPSPEEEQLVLRFRRADRRGKDAIMRTAEQESTYQAQAA